MQIRPRRSVLYMPGSNARALEKAKIAPRRRADPRSGGRRRARGQGDGAQPGLRRPSRPAATASASSSSASTALDTPWGQADLAAAAAAAPDAVLLPKPGGGADIARATRGARQGRRAGQDAAVGHDRDAARHPQRGGDRRRLAGSPARGSPASCMGTNDLVKETRADLSANRRPALYWLSATVTAARAYGLDVLDGVYNNFKDADGFKPRVRARPRARLRRQDADPSRPGRGRQRGVRAAGGRGGVRAQDHRRLRRSRRTRARASSRSRAAWWSCCTPRWRSAPSPSPRPSQQD